MHLGGMPRYFFDIRDGDETITDDVGAECADVGAARGEALRALAEMLKDFASANDEARAFAVTVRDIGGTRLLEARLDYAVNMPDAR